MNTGFGKKVLAMVWLLSYCACCFSQPLSVPLPDPIIKPDIEGLNQNLDKLELIWNNLIIENGNLRIALETSEQSQQKLWDMYNESQTYCFKVEQQLEKSERKLKIWRGTATVLAVTSLASGIMLLIRSKHDNS